MPGPVVADRFTALVCGLFGPRRSPRRRRRRGMGAARGGPTCCPSRGRGPTSRSTPRCSPGLAHPRPPGGAGTAPADRGRGPGFDDRPLPRRQHRAVVGARRPTHADPRRPADAPGGQRWLKIPTRGHGPRRRPGPLATHSAGVGLGDNRVEQPRSHHRVSCPAPRPDPSPAGWVRPELDRRSLAPLSVVVWQFSGADVEREQRALKLIAGSFFVFAAYVAAQAVWDLVARSEPSESVPGIVLAALLLMVMPVLAIVKRRVGGRPSLLRRGRQRPDHALQLPVRHPARRPGRQRDPRLVVGRPDRRARHRRPRLARRTRAWRGEVCCDAC